VTNVHTLVVSDLHLADLERRRKDYGSLWKRYKKPKFFLDRDFRRFLQYKMEQLEGPIELVLNGDTFDFDSVIALPEVASLRLSWLERLRGLSPEHPKSRFKIQVILEAHPVWVETMRTFLAKGHRLVFIIGNHDLELHWPGVQQEIRKALLPMIDGEPKGEIRFCEWFYISEKDTLLEHGNQYDAYCVCSNPIHPLVRVGQKFLVRLPFGNIASRLMVNGMGLMNPHTSSSFIKNSFLEYLVFYYNYVLRVQPFLMWTWLWSSFATWAVSLNVGLRPALRDPLTMDQRLEEIAQKSNASVMMLLALREVHVHPAIFNPFMVLKELWLDRVLIFLLILLFGFQVFSVLNIANHAGMLSFILPVLILLPGFVFYARSVQSEVEACERAVFHYAPLSAQIARVKRMITGHSHRELHTHIEAESRSRGEKVQQSIEMLNTGTWSPAFKDVECQQPFGRKCFVWIRPDALLGARVAGLYEWSKEGPLLIPKADRVIPTDPEKIEYSTVAKYGT
jgi:UDP-2,3-diacylglucosamine pyrophosphatase LpxH